MTMESRIYNRERKVSSVNGFAESWIATRERMKLDDYVTPYKKVTQAPAGVAQWIECQPANQRVTGSIPSQGTCLSCGPGLRWGTCERQPHIDVFLPLFLPPFLSL